MGCHKGIQEYGTMVKSFIPVYLYLSRDLRLKYRLYLTKVVCSLYSRKGFFKDSSSPFDTFCLPN